MHVGWNLLAMCSHCNGSNTIQIVVWWNLARLFQPSFPRNKQHCGHVLPWRVLWVGTDNKSDESLVHVDNRVRMIRIAKNFTEFQRWDPQVALPLQSSSEAAWNPHPTGNGLSSAPNLGGPRRRYLTFHC